ncbi:Glycosyl hydrolases family 28 [Pustulibacterium marinum]|uniref:Glycosyl hydrolases family 28 n=1 Tax=Pustulibacterium marinum TaxID=1224947 RepID=A0A1I7IPW6_9FLAO|nr:glycoside hydrolase family 28 protein [Pustulibacterium marinum]SFU74941.1 Glycosyl hydrolases family 28 [Pustulibacterium marinum]
MIKKSTLLFLTLIAGLFISCDTKSESPPELQFSEVNFENIPFEMPKLKIPDYGELAKISIVDLGAVSNNKEKTSEAIKMAIDSVHKMGGGTVVIPKGEWLTKTIHFKSNVNLHLDEGAVLLFSEDPNDYLPAVKTSWEGMECINYSPLVYAYECENIAITGKGELKAKIDVWKTWFSRPKAHMNSLKRLYYLAANDSAMANRNMVNDSSHLRPHFIQFNRSKNILLEDVTITNSPFWTIHPYQCENVVIKGLNVYAHGHNNDGVDPEMSKNMLIENCVFDQGDDAISVKAGRNQEAWRLNAPAENIVIRNCKVKNGHQLLAIGSELSGGIKNVYMENCDVADGAKLFHLLFIKTNERRGGYVDGIYMKNITSGKIDKGILGIETDVLYQWRDLVPTLEKKLTPITNIYLENFKAKDVQFISKIEGQEELSIENVVLKNVTASNVSGEEIRNENVTNFEMK